MSEKQSKAAPNWVFFLVCAIVVLAGITCVVLGTVLGSKDRVQKRHQIEALEERVEELEKKAESYKPPRTGFKKIGNAWHPAINATKDEVKSAGLSTLEESKREYWKSQGVYDPAVAEREDFFCGSLVFRSCMKADECSGEDNQWECHGELYKAFKCLERETWCLDSEKYDEYAAGECINSIMGSWCEDWDKRHVATKECAKVCTKPNDMRAWWNAPVFEKVLR